ncbi:MAG: prenyltransferase/squalene oxidase repeat-containing protein [Polyangiaceae bacterium]
MRNAEPFDRATPSHSRRSGVLPIAPEVRAPRARGPQREEVGAALGRALARLTAMQRADGAWEVDVEEGPSLLSAYLIVKRRFGALGEREACAGAKALLAAQREDGSFAPYPGADAGSPMATALAAAALEATRVPRARGAVARADRWVELAGGESALMTRFHEHLDLSVVFLVAANRLSSELLPEMPAEILTTPFERLVDRRAHLGNVLGMLVLMALSDREPRGSTREAIRARIEALVAPHVTEAGGFFGWPWQTLTCLVGLAAVGAKPTDELCARALAWLARQERYDDGALRFAALGNDVLSTAHAVSALTEASDTTDAAARGVAFLAASQSTVPMARPNQRKTGAPRVGGWSAHRDDALFPDTDTTAAVLSALARRPRRRDARGVLPDPAIEQGAAWLAGMQNPSGGFPMYVWDLSEKARGPIETRAPLGLERSLGVIHVLFDPPPELGDPATEGVTGRVLGALGRAGMTRKDPIASRAIAFLHQQQCDHGGFWGRWMACYLAETATILEGLAAIGEDTRLPYAERAVEFLLAHQNPDGGWGERPEAYADPSLAGIGPSMAAVTAHVILGLLAIADPPYEAIQAGIQWLLANQRPDGGWTNDGFLHARLLPDHFYAYTLPALTTPIVALARYRDRLERFGRLVSSTRRKRRLGMRARQRTSA